MNVDDIIQAGIYFGVEEESIHSLSRNSGQKLTDVQMEECVVPRTHKNG